MNIDTKMLTVALYVGAHYARGVTVTREDVRAEIIEKMIENDMPDSALQDIENLVSSLGYFAECVRAAERKKLPVIPMHGEKLPQA